jgi:hypothetical protein
MAALWFRRAQIQRQATLAQRRYLNKSRFDDFQIQNDKTLNQLFCIATGGLLSGACR